MMYRFYLIRQRGVDDWIVLDRFNSIRFTAKSYAEAQTKIDRIWEGL